MKVCKVASVLVGKNDIRSLYIKSLIYFMCIFLLVNILRHMYIQVIIQAFTLIEYIRDSGLEWDYCTKAYSLSSTRGLQAESTHSNLLDWKNVTSCYPTRPHASLFDPRRGKLWDKAILLAVSGLTSIVMPNFFKLLYISFPTFLNLQGSTVHKPHCLSLSL